MVDAELLDEIEDAIGRIGGISKLSQESAENCIQEVADRFVSDTSKIWWWESLKGPATCLEYGEADGLVTLEGLIDSSEVVLLVVTDDEAPPWPVYRGKMQAIVALLRESRFFEFILVPENLGFAIFDTHHNQIICANAPTL